MSRYGKEVRTSKIAPYDESDEVDLFVIAVADNAHVGAFIFAKTVLLKKNIFSTNGKEGKRAIRVYTPWGATVVQRALNHLIAPLIVIDVNEKLQWVVAWIIENKCGKTHRKCLKLALYIDIINERSEINRGAGQHVGVNASWVCNGSTLKY